MLILLALCRIRLDSSDNNNKIGLSDLAKYESKLLLKLLSYLYDKDSTHEVLFNLHTTYLLLYDQIYQYIIPPIALERMINIVA